MIRMRVHLHFHLRPHTSTSPSSPSADYPGQHNYGRAEETHTETQNEPHTGYTSRRFRCFSLLHLKWCPASAQTLATRSGPTFETKPTDKGALNQLGLELWNRAVPTEISWVSSRVAFPGHTKKIHLKELLSKIVATRKRAWEPCDTCKHAIENILRFYPAGT